METTQNTTPATKTVYRMSAETAKHYWQHSEQFDSFEALMAKYGPWLAKQRSINVRFYTEQVLIQSPAE